jgi:hypothetical protein
VRRVAPGTAFQSTPGIIRANRCQWLRFRTLATVSNLPSPNPLPTLSWRCRFSHQGNIPVTALAESAVVIPALTPLSIVSPAREVLNIDRKRERNGRSKTLLHANISGPRSTESLSRDATPVAVCRHAAHAVHMNVVPGHLPYGSSRSHMFTIDIFSDGNGTHFQARRTRSTLCNPSQRRFFPLLTIVGKKSEMS